MSNYENLPTRGKDEESYTSPSTLKVKKGQSEGFSYNNNKDPLREGSNSNSPFIKCHIKDKEGEEEGVYSPPYLNGGIEEKGEKYNHHHHHHHHQIPLGKYFPSPLDYPGFGSSFLTTDKRRLNRFFLIVAVFLSLFFILCSLLDTAEFSDFSTVSHWQLEQTRSSSSSFKVKRLPQVIIIGARKSGTRALIDMLNLHPKIEKAAMEVHFFDRDDNYSKGIEWYVSMMPDTTEDEISIEKSPSYFVTPEVPERIFGMNSSIKLLLIVKEPVTRVISDFVQIRSKNFNAAKPNNSLMATTTTKSPSLEELVLQSDGSVNVHYKAIRISLYARYMQRWLDVFPLSQIHVIDGDALIRDPYPQLKEVEKFLGLEPALQRDNFYFNATKGFYCWRKLPDFEGRNETGLHCLNESKGRRHPPLKKNIVEKLRQFYNPHNHRFYEMVGRDFAWPEK